MANAEIEKQKVQEITEKLEQGLQELFESEKYKSYLNTMSKFHNYSYNNTMLIAMQKPDASLVAGYNAWQKGFERHVKKGEKGIRILAPAPYKIKEEQDVINPDTQELVLDEQGKPKKEVVEYTIPAFKVVPVFDVSQTEGKELPALGAQELLSSVEGYQDFMQALMEVSPVSIGFEDIPGDSKGYFHFEEKRIAIQEGMSESQTVKTGVHEVSHAKLHDREINQSADLQMEDFKDKNTKEVEAESIAYTVCQHFGIDTSDYSFGYIAGWSSGKDMKELKSSLNTIRKTASELITQIEDRLRELQRDRQQEQERANETVLASDVIVKISASMGSEYEVDRITNKTFNEVQAILKDYADHGEADNGIFIQERLESKGAELIPIMASNGFNDEFLEFYDLEYDYDTNDVTSSSELSIMKQAENYMNRMEFKHPVLTDEERNLITNYAYKLDDMDKTRLLIEQLVYQEEYAQQDVGLTVINAQAEIDFLPDGMVGLSEMHEYGYSWDEMLPLTKERAMVLYSDVQLYQLHIDESESLIEDENEITEHGGLFGVERSEWQRYLERQEQNYDLKEYIASKEEQLLHGNEDRFGIYQLKRTDEMRDYRFMAMDYLEMKGIAIDRENYELVYTGTLGNMGLEDIYTRFNMDHPEDFTGHSLSVSDVVVLHQNGQNSSHYVDSIGYREVAQFIKEQTAEKEHEGQVLLVNYDKWTNVTDLDFNQNYFAIDDPYGDEDFRLLHLQNRIKDITPNGVHYDTYEEANEALALVEREIANIPGNKENRIGSYQVNGRAQLEQILSARELTKQREADKVSYYVIEDLATWKENSADRSVLERFKNLYDAMAKFSQYKAETREYPNDDARTTLGVSIGGIEFDILHVREAENYLVHDFAQIKVALENSQFLDDLQTVHDAIGFDKIRIHREMTPEEVKDFVKQRFEYQLKNGGIEDISAYMDRFDLLYEHGKTEHLMPTANQRQVTDVLAVPEWENTYLEQREPEQLAFSIADRYVSIQSCTDGYDYSIFDEQYKLLDGGLYDNPDITIKEALYEVIMDLKEPTSMGGNDVIKGNVKPDDVLLPVDYEKLMEKMEEAERIVDNIDSSVVAKFRAKTEELFHEISGESPTDIEQTVYAHVQAKIDEYDIDAKIVDVVVSGSRCRGMESTGSDLDVVVELNTGEKEDSLFNVFNEDGLMIGGIEVDINPITEQNTGTLESYLPIVEAYLSEKLQIAATETVDKEIQVTLTVAECGEFHNLGEFYEGINSVDEAITIFNQIPPERMYGIRSIGINIHEEGTADYEDVELDILSGNTIDLELLEYVPNITGNPKAMAVIAEIVEKVPSAEIWGSLEKWKQAEYKPLAKIEELEEANYNMIDNVINNEKPKKEQDCSCDRSSIKEKLAEKKAAIEQREKAEKSAPEKEVEKKTEREM